MQQAFCLLDIDERGREEKFQLKTTFALVTGVDMNSNEEIMINLLPFSVHARVRNLHFCE
jgi:hypothetical protein